MANYQCDACEELRQRDPNLIINGFTDEHCENIADAKGLNGNSNNCDDVHLMNDCFIGNMEKEVNAYEPCDWKTFMRRFIPNVWATIKAIICWLCGLQCQTDIIAKGVSLKISEDDEDETVSYVVAGKGVSFLETGTQGRTSQVTMLYIAGGLVRVQGSLVFHKDAFTEAIACWNFDKSDGTIRKSTARHGNSEWENTSGTINGMAAGGELLFEIRINKAQYPFIKNLFAGIGGATGGGMYQINLTPFQEGEWAYGQHGNCDSETGQGEDGHSNGHLVEPGWIYVQARMVNIGLLNAKESSDPADSKKGRYSPRGFMGIRIDTSKVEC